MTIDEKREELLKKLYKEQEDYTDSICVGSPREALDYAYSWVTREDILVAIEYMELTEKEMDVLMNMPCPLQDIYEDFCNVEGDYMDIIRCSVSDYIKRMEDK